MDTTYIQETACQVWLAVYAAYNAGQWEKLAVWLFSALVGLRMGLYATKKSYGVSCVACHKIAALFRYLFVPVMPEPTELAKALIKMVNVGESKLLDGPPRQFVCGPLHCCHYENGEVMRATVKVGEEEVLDRLHDVDKFRVCEAIKERICLHMRAKDIDRYLLAMDKIRTHTIRSQTGCDEVPLVARLPKPTLADALNNECLEWVGKPNGK